MELDIYPKKNQVLYVKYIPNKTFNRLKTVDFRILTSFGSTEQIFSNIKIAVATIALKTVYWNMRERHLALDKNLLTKCLQPFLQILQFFIYNNIVKYVLIWSRTTTSKQSL